MPLYEYKCVKCGHRFEKIEGYSASETKKCPKCGAKAERQLSSPAIQFKGTGWYVTDYAGKGKGGASSEPGGTKSGGESGGGSSDGPGGDGSTSKPTEAKSDAKPAESKPSAEKTSTKKRK